MDLHLRSSAILRALLGAIAAVAVAHLAAQLGAPAFDVPSSHPAVRALNMDQEPSVPTLLAMALWAIAFVLATLIALGEHRARRRHAGAWAFFAVVLGYLLADEQLGLHEALAVSLSSSRAQPALRATWVVPYGVAAGAGVALGYRVARELPMSVRWWLRAAIVTFASGAAGMELLGGLYLERHGHDLFYHLTFVTAEESMEMIGLAFLVRALLECLHLTQPHIHLHLD
ncbi:MAG TPA: hypothetical protein VEC57_19125 [Candidatus Limnocylindrales bacterium]|nr:hypothetical protein [Candidatus Limnocylindrales bacterium]